jgi:hypothetical protein
MSGDNQPALWGQQSHFSGELAVAQQDGANASGLDRRYRRCGGSGITGDGRTARSSEHITTVPLAARGHHDG